MTYGVPDLPLSGSTRDESTEVEHTMYNVFNKTICVCYYTNSSSGLLFIMCGYCYYLDPAAVRTCMQTNFTVHGQPPQFLIASAANALGICFSIKLSVHTCNSISIQVQILLITTSIIWKYPKKLKQKIYPHWDPTL